MKRIILLIFSFLILASLCHASPFLVCDPSPDPITAVEIEVTKGGITTIYSNPYSVIGADVRLLDLVGYENGSYIFRARWKAANDWWSDWSDPLAAVKSGKPGNFRIK